MPPRRISPAFARLLYTVCRTRSAVICFYFEQLLPQLFFAGSFKLADEKEHDNEPRDGERILSLVGFFWCRTWKLRRRSPALNFSNGPFANVVRYEWNLSAAATHLFFLALFRYKNCKRSFKSGFLSKCSHASSSLRPVNIGKKRKKCDNKMRDEE